MSEIKNAVLRLTDGTVLKIHIGADRQLSAKSLTSDTLQTFVLQGGGSVFVQGDKILAIEVHE